jgi:Viral BACON domain
VSLSLTNILLSTNFAIQGLQGWVPSPLGLLSGWSVVNLGTQYAAQYNGGGNTQLFAGNSAWTDYTLTVPIKLSSMNNYPGGIRARVNPVTGASYMLWLYPASGQFILYRAPGWNISQGLVQIAAGSAAFDISQFHNVAMTFNGSQIQVFYDGKAVITATDSTYSSGLIALEGDNQLITYGNIVVNGPQPNTGSLNPSPTSLNYSAAWNGPNPTPQTVQLNSAGGSLAWTAVANAPWLSVSPSSGITSASLQVSVNSFSLSGGTYNGIVTILWFGAVNSIQQINVNLTVVVPPPAIVLSPGSMSFVAVIGQPAPPSQALGVVNAGQGSFSWTSSTDSSWLIASPGSGSTPGVTNVSVNVAGLSTGTYTGHVIVSANGIANSPQSIPVTVQVMAKDLNENFSNAAAGWIISPMGHANGWSVSSGVYSYSGLGFSQSCAGKGAWTDYIFDANIKLSNLSNWPGGVRARVNPATGAGYVVWLYPGSRLAILYKVGAWNINDPSLTQLAQAALNFDTAAAHDLKTIFKGNQISVYWDGQFLMSATDSTYTSGFVCLDADNQPISYSNVQVAGVQNPVTLDTPSPASLTFATLPGVTPPSKTVNISAGGAATTWAVTSNASWLSAATSSTLTPGVITVSANPAGLPQGVYNGSLSVFAPGATNSPVTIPVTLAVKSAILSVSPSSLTYFGAISLNPRSQNIQVTNSGTGSLNWTASATSPWLGLSAASGLAPATIVATPNTTGLAIGSYNNTITVSSPDVTNSPATLAVSLQVGSLLFSDNFSSGAGNWTVGPLGLASGWSVANGFYTYNGGGPTQSWAGNASWANYTVATDFRLASLNDYPGGLRGRLDPNTGASYGVWIYPGERVLKLFRIGQWNIDSGFALLGQSGQLSMDTNSHTLRLSFKGSAIQVYYDESLAITASDPTYAQGAIAFDVSNQPISFTNVTVISLP